MMKISKLIAVLLASLLIVPAALAEEGEVLGCALSEDKQVFYRATKIDGKLIIEFLNKKDLLVDDVVLALSSGGATEGVDIDDIYKIMDFISAKSLESGTPLVVRAKDKIIAAQNGQGQASLEFTGTNTGIIEGLTSGTFDLVLSGVSANVDVKNCGAED